MTVWIPDTTRPKKPQEKDGVEYHFVTKQQFDADALNNKYVCIGLWPVVLSLVIGFTPMSCTHCTFAGS